MLASVSHNCSTVLLISDLTLAFLDGELNYKESIFHKHFTVFVKFCEVEVFFTKCNF